jgi:hypothetical protein
LTATLIATSKSSSWALTKTQKKKKIFMFFSVRLF